MRSKIISLEQAIALNSNEKTKYAWVYDMFAHADALNRISETVTPADAKTLLDKWYETIKGIKQIGNAKPIALLPKYWKPYPVENFPSQEAIEELRHQKLFYYATEINSNQAND